MIRDRDARDALLVAIEHIGWATKQGQSLADIADSTGRTLGDDPSLLSATVLLASMWLQVRKRPVLFRVAA